MLSYYENKSQSVQAGAAGNATTPVYTKKVRAGPALRLLFATFCDI